MESFFHRLYKYRQLERINQKENFLSEIFSFCLQHDEELLKRFLTTLNIQCTVSSCTSSTQVVTPFGRPDVYVEINRDTLIIIECKIDASQEETQLNRYAELLLSQTHEDKHLIYLTKHFEKTNPPTGTQFSHIRWYQIYEMLSDTEFIISKELRNFLKTEGMSKQTSLGLHEISALKDFYTSVAKMDEFLYAIIEFVKTMTNEKILWKGKFIDGYYGIDIPLIEKKLWVGFWQFEDHNEMRLGMSVDEFPKKSRKFSKVDKLFDSLAWEEFDEKDGEHRTWYIASPVTSFFSGNTFDDALAKSFIKKHLLTVKELFC